MSEEKVRLGFIGCGNHATRSLYPSLRLAPVELVAVCDLEEEKARRNARLFAAERVYTDYREMIEREKLEAVIAVASPALHYEVAKYALSRGLNAFVEKPPSHNSEEARELMELSREAGRFVMVGFMKRFAAGYLMAKQVIQTAEFGKPSFIESKMTSSPYRDELQQLRDHSIHHLDLVRFFMGEVERVYAEEVNAGQGRFGFAVALRFKNGACGVMNLSSLQSWGTPGERLEISGEGRFVVVDNVVNATYYRGRLLGEQVGFNFEMDALTWQPNFLMPGDFNSALALQGYAGEIRHFAECTLCGQRPSPDIGDGYYALRLLESIQKSIATGTAVCL